MKLLREITEKELDLKKLSKVPKEYRIRKAAKAIVMHDGKIALMYVSKYKYHKLPGGGIRKKETIENALRREVLEEVGCEIEILGEVGMIIELRDRWNLKQISYCFLAEITGELKKQGFTKEEMKEGFVLKWVQLDEAISLLKNDKPGNDEGHFIRQRDLTFLKKADELLNHRC